MRARDGSRSAQAGRDRVAGAMTRLYFAYGSNLKLERMRDRIPSARARGPARLPGRALTLDKRGSDGSAKANVTPQAGSWVWGALYEIEPTHWPDLDRCEPGYERVRIEVVTLDGAPREAHTYAAVQLTTDPTPFDWYKRLIVEGAREHGLPPDWVETLERLPERRDPRRGP